MKEEESGGRYTGSGPAVVGVRLEGMRMSERRGVGRRR